MSLHCFHNSGSALSRAFSPACLLPASSCSSVTKVLPAAWALTPLIKHFENYVFLKKKNLQLVICLLWFVKPPWSKMCRPSYITMNLVTPGTFHKGCLDTKTLHHISAWREYKALVSKQSFLHEMFKLSCCPTMSFLLIEALNLILLATG